MRISDWSSDVCSSDVSGRRLSREVPEQLSRLSGNQHATGMNASCAADLIRSPGPGKGTHFHPLATRVNERFDPTPPSPASDIGRSEEHTSELQSLMRIAYDDFYLNTKTKKHTK